MGRENELFSVLNIALEAAIVSINPLTKKKPGFTK